MANFVASATFQDNMSAGVNAATAALNKAADAADNLTTTVTKAGPSFDTLLRRADPATVALTKLAKAQSDLATATATANAAVASGAATVEQRNTVVEAAAAKVQALTQATANALPPTQALTASHGSMTFAARQLEVQMTQLVSGIATGQPVFMSLVQQGHQVADVMVNQGVSVKALGGYLAGLISPMVAAVAGAAAVVTGLGYLGYAAETNERQMLSLQTALRATRDDFTTMASEANAAARAVAATSGFSLSDSRSAAQTISAVPNFTGNQQQLQALIAESGDLAAVLGVSLPAAAQKFAAAIQDPAKTAQDWATSHSFGMTQALADQIKQMADSGDKAAAFAKELDIVKAATAGAADQSKTGLQKALEDLGKAFTAAGSDGKSFADVLGKGVQNVAITAVEQLREIVDLMEKARDLSNARSLPGAPTFNPATAGNPGPLGSPTLGPATASGEQAVGLFQVLPSSAAGAGFSQSDISNTGGNIQAGIAILLQKYFQSGGNIDQTLALYGGYGKDTTAASGYINKVKSADPSTLDPSVLAAIQQQVANQHLPQNLALLAERLPVVESSGRQYSQNIQSMTVTADLGLPVPPIPPTGDANGISNTSTKDEALVRANKAGTSIGASADAAADITLYTKALAEMSAQGETTGAEVDKLNEALQKSRVAYQDAIAPAQKMLDSLARQTAATDNITAAYANGAAAVAHATNLAKAEADARTVAAEGTAQYIAIVQAETAALDASTRAKSNNLAMQSEADQKQQLDYLQAELGTLNESADVRSRDLAVFKEQQTIAQTMPGLDAARRDALVANAAAIADATSALQRQQQAAQELGNMLTQAFDQVGNAITQAFVQGQGASVNFGNIARAVIASVAQEILKLAVINPILNSVVGGTNRTTLSDVLNLGTAGGSSSGSGGFGSLLSLGGTASSVSGALGGPSIGSMLGLTGQNGLLSSLGLGNVGSSISGFLGTNTGLGALSGASAIGPEGAYSAAQVAASSSGGATIGSLLGGVGLGFGAGSLLNSLIGGNSMGGTVGSGAGALAGTAIGSLFGGPLVGGLLGGLLGGAGGGLVGPHPASMYSSTGLSISNGQFSAGQTLSQIDPNAAAQAAQLKSDTAAINAFLASNSLLVTSLGKISQIGDNTPGGYQDPSKAADLGSAFSNFRFSAVDPTENSLLADKSFASADELQTWVTTFNQVQASAKAYLTDTTAVMKALGVTTGSLTDNIAALNSAYDNDKSAMDALISSGDLSAQQTADLTTAESNLASIRDKSIQAASDAALAQFTQTDAGLQTRYVNAEATINGTQPWAQTAQLFAFDQGVQQQRDQLSQSLVATYGDSVKTTQGYADQMAALENTLGEERLAIQQSFNDKITATATSSVTSLASYVAKLQSGSQSPLSPTAQYGLASSQFDAVSGAAKAGDFNSYSNITGYADSFLSASQAVNGSGTAYVNDYNRVLSALSDLASVAPDTLTGAVYTAEMQTQNQTLEAGFAAVKAEVAALRAAVVQGSAAPSRLG